MESTMMDIPLTVTSIMRYGSTMFGDKEVVTCTGHEATTRRAPTPSVRRAGGPAGGRAAAAGR